MSPRLDVGDLIAQAVVKQLAARLDELEASMGEFAKRVNAPEPLLSRRQAAQWAGCSVGTVDAWLRAGVPHVRLGGPGGAPRFLASELRTWLHARQSCAAASGRATYGGSK